MRIRLVRYLVVTVMSVAFAIGYALSPVLAVQRAQRIQPNDSDVGRVARFSYGYDELTISVRPQTRLRGARVPGGNVGSARAEHVCGRPCGYDGLQRLRVSRTSVATKTGGKAGDKRNTPDRGALIDIADEADKRRGGVTPGEAEILKDWGKELGVPVRGPEAHPGRGHGAKEHIHVGPKNHIPVKR